MVLLQHPLQNWSSSAKSDGESNGFDESAVERRTPRGGRVRVHHRALPPRSIWHRVAECQEPARSDTGRKGGRPHRNICVCTGDVQKVRRSFERIFDLRREHTHTRSEQFKKNTTGSQVCSMKVSIVLWLVYLIFVGMPLTHSTVR